MLTKEVALIQGPPGTGKTYCGALGVKILLDNRTSESSPIVVACYTNHALD
jgi:superfamily II DNA or RNA helicase